MFKMFYNLKAFMCTYCYRYIAFSATLLTNNKDANHLELWFSNFVILGLLCTLIEKPKELLFKCVIFIDIYCIRNENCLKLLLNPLKITLKSLHATYYKHNFYEKYYFPKQKLSENGPLLYIFMHLFNAWLKRTQLTSHSCFCSPSVITCCFGWRTWRKSGMQVCNWKGRNIWITFPGNLVVR